MDPSINALARSSKKRSFFLAFLQDLARSCGILQESCCKIPAKSHEISQDLAVMQEKVPFLGRSCKNVFTAMDYWNITAGTCDYIAMILTYESIQFKILRTCMLKSIGCITTTTKLL